MLPNLNGPELEKTCKLTKFKNVNEEKETVESKLNNVEEYQASSTSIKKKDETVNAYITYIKKDETVNKLEESWDPSLSNRPNKMT